MDYKRLEEVSAQLTLSVNDVKRLVGSWVGATDDDDLAGSTETNNDDDFGAGLKPIVRGGIGSKATSAPVRRDVVSARSQKALEGLRKKVKKSQIKADDQSQHQYKKRDKAADSSDEDDGESRFSAVSAKKSKSASFLDEYQTYKKKRKR